LLPKNSNPLPANPAELLCIGNAIVDVFTAADPVWLDSMGVKEPVQHISRDQAQVIFDALDRTENDVVLSSGGAASNVAKIAAMLNTGASFVGCAGGDEHAAFFEQDLRESGVVPFLSVGTEKTGLCFAFNCSGETRSPPPKTMEVPLRIAASPGAALELTEADIPEDLFAGAEAVALDGYMLDRRPLIQRILRLADRRGIPVALDVASVFQVKEKTEEILHYSRNYPLILFMNAAESIVFYDTIRKGAARVEAASEKEEEMLIIREICPAIKCITEGEIFPIIVIKLGGRGALVLAGGNIYHEETFTIIPRNTVGAGDAFCAAFLSAWIRGKPIRECAAFGNKVARKILEVPGTRIKSGKLKSLAKLLR
jgi:sugar/nucleoside kinase (ribokinase family)